VWLVTCDPDAQRARLARRGMAAEDAERRIAAQGDLAGRARGLPGTVVVDASGPPADTEERVAAALAAALGPAGVERRRRRQG
jgi:dephospho-CoA kinase